MIFKHFSNWCHTMFFHKFVNGFCVVWWYSNTFHFKLIFFQWIGSGFSVVDDIQTPFMAKLIFSNQNHELVFVCKCSWCPGRNQKNGLKRLSPRWLICSYAFPLCYKLTIKLQIFLISMGSTLVFVYCVRKNRALCFSARYPCYFSLPDDRIEEPKAHTTHVFTGWVPILVIL